MAGTFLGARAPSLFFIPHARRLPSVWDTALSLGLASVDAGGDLPPRLTADPAVNQGGVA